MAISEVIETMEDLVQFVKDLSPCPSKVCQDVEARRRDLLNPYHRENLGQHLEQVKTLAPILICSMKIFIQILQGQGQQGNKSTDEAVENRNYLAKRMTEEISQITRILEETAREDSPAKIIPGLAITSSSSSVALSRSDMTFSEMMKSINSSSSAVSASNIQQVVEMGRKIADGFDGQARSAILQACEEIERVQRSGEKQRLTSLTRSLEQRVNEAVIGRVVEDLADVTTPIKLFADAVGSRDRVGADRRGAALKAFSARLCKTAGLVAAANARNRRRAEALHHLSSQVQTLTPQVRKFRANKCWLLSDRLFSTFVPWN